MSTARPVAPAAVSPRRARRVILALVGIALFLTFAALGTWQVERRAWKLALIERVQDRVHASPVPAPTADAWPEVNRADHEYLPVTARGHWLPDKAVLATAVTELGAGFWVIGALQRDDGTQVLVNRGFVPQDQRNQWLPPISVASEPATDTAAPGGPVEVTGLLRITEPGGGFLRSNDAEGGRWFSRDVAAISAALGLPRAAPFFIDAGLPDATAAAPGASGDTDTRNLAAGPWPRPGMTVIRFHNSHLVYILTWYGLALMVVVGGWYVARYERSLALAGNGSAHTSRDESSAL